MIQISITTIESREVDKAANLCAEAFIQTPFTSTVMGGKGEKVWHGSEVPNPLTYILGWAHPRDNPNLQKHYN